MKFLTLIAAVILISFQACSQVPTPSDSESKAQYSITKTNAEWRDILSPEQYRILREKGTERAFTGAYNDFKKSGTFTCAACSTPLFSSATKFDSGTGWPSFYDVVSKENVKEVPDHSHGWVRTEVVCGACGGHLGHVFEDGPKPTGLRYCINSVSLSFDEKK